MKRYFGLFIFILGIALSAYPEKIQAQHPTLRAVKKAHGVSVWVDDELFTEYKFSSDQKYPYFYPVNGPATGQSVTTESSEPWPHHHSLFFGSDKVNGGNYWQESNDRGQIVTQETRLLKAKGQRIVFENKNLWQRPGASSPFRDQRTVTITAPTKNLRVIDFDITLTALEDVTIEKNNHALFSARMVPELSVESGGTLVNAEGHHGEDETWGEHSPWADYWGQRNGVREGLAILSHPQNPWHPPTWFTRDYGFFSPTPMYWLADGRFDMDKGDTLDLRYRVIVHTGATKEANIAKLYNEWTK